MFEVRDVAVTISSTEGRTGVERDPRLSVIVISFNRAGLLARCLEALVPQANAGDVEILVVMEKWREATVKKGCFPSVRWLCAPDGFNVPRMRALAIEKSRGSIVALLEDDCVPDHTWCGDAIAAHATMDIAIGGAVEPGPYRRALDWSVYFCEYGRFMLPLRERANMALALTANNITYKRPQLMEAVRVRDDGFFDFFVHEAWQHANLPMRVEPTLVVRNVNTWSLGTVTKVPYHHGRAYAAKRFVGGPQWRRVLFGLLAPALPVLKVGRIVADTLQRKRLIGRLIQALPWIVVFMTSWSVGEAVGYLFGPGTSESRWR